MVLSRLRIALHTVFVVAQTLGIGLLNSTHNLHKARLQE